MAYITKALIPETPNGSYGNTRSFHYLSDVVAKTGIVVSGLPKEGANLFEIISNDIIILNSPYPISAFVSGIAKANNIPSIGFLSKDRRIKSKDYSGIVDVTVSGAKDLTKVLEIFLKEGKLYERKRRGELPKRKN